MHFCIFTAKPELPNQCCNFYNLERISEKRLSECSLPCVHVCARICLCTDLCFRGMMSDMFVNISTDILGSFLANLAHWHFSPSLTGSQGQLTGKPKCSHTPEIKDLGESYSSCLLLTIDHSIPGYWLAELINQEPCIERYDMPYYTPSKFISTVYCNRNISFFS